MNKEQLKDGALLAKDILLIPHSVPARLRRGDEPLETKILGSVAELIFVGAPLLCGLIAYLEHGNIAEGLAYWGVMHGVMIVGVSSAVQE